jgi:hypothetical protein
MSWKMQRRATQMPEVQIWTKIPEAVLRLLEKSVGEYSDFVAVYHCVNVHGSEWVGVAGDGANGSYEWFIANTESGDLQTSDCGYGSPLFAFFEVLSKYGRDL